MSSILSNFFVFSLHYPKYKSQHER